MYFLGTVSGASGAYYNNVTGASGVGAFTIPPRIKSLYLSPGVSGLRFAMSVATGVTAFMTATNGAGFLPQNQLSGPFRTIQCDNNQVVAGFHPTATGWDLRVFGAPT